jgi:prevent-host-death family protein
LCLIQNYRRNVKKILGSLKTKKTFPLIRLDQPDPNGYSWFNTLIVKEKLMIINVSEAKANLSKLIDMAYHGEEVIIAKNNLPLVALVAHKPKEKRKLGLLKGQISIPDHFNDEDEEINTLFYGESC